MNLRKKQSKNSCYTYFSIVGDFPLQEIKELINLPSFRSWNKDDIRKADNKPYGFSNYSICRCEEYNPYTDKQMEESIAPLIDKIDILNKIREKYDVKFYLNVVPHLYVGEINPTLSPSMVVIDFCYKTRTKIDVDTYLYK